MIHSRATVLLCFSPSRQCVVRTYISPIGYNSTSVTRPVLSRGLDTGDEVVLLRPAGETDENRAREAIGDVERLLTEIEPAVSLETERVPHDDISEAVFACSDVICAAEGDRIVNLGGGARDVLIPLATASIAHVSLIETALFFSDIDGAVREWELPRLTAPVPSAGEQTLIAIGRHDHISIPDLTDATGQSKSTVTRHVNQLERDSVVETWKDGRTKYARLSFTGQMLLRERGARR